MFHTFHFHSLYITSYEILAWYNKSCELSRKIVNFLILIRQQRHIEAIHLIMRQKDINMTERDQSKLCCITEWRDEMAKTKDMFMFSGYEITVPDFRDI